MEGPALAPAARLRERRLPPDFRVTGACASAGPSTSPLAELRAAEEVL